ncbi:MAG TPA: hypothetical protein PKE26_01810 [Kiritimatiellia bacterium]|nr:hypothetical protein [Kiritimatiellia bacterium]HMO97825.1 hypothetical protein [Kiritimatiellia bacterium]HMP96428.1 hypothetical protein [Kiritimatiellia bacterium]
MIIAPTSIGRRTIAVLACLLVIGLSGCDDDLDHQPPAGQGAVIINNQTGSDIRVFLDGEEQPTVRAYRDRAIDRPPGVYRLVLDQRGGDRTFRDDIDVIANRLTVVDVATDPFHGARYDVAVFFRNP